MIQYRYLIIRCLIGLLGALALPGWSQTGPTLRVDHIGVNDGLTQGSVYYMLKDSRSFLWFGTQDGLNRYDGHRFRTFRPSSSEPGHIQGVNIFGIIEDPDGNLWVGTEAGLNRYDRQRDRFTCYYATQPVKPGEQVRSRKPVLSRTLPFYVDKTELLYLNDAEGLVRLNYHTGQKTILNPSLHPTKEYDLQSSTVRTPTGDVWLHAPKGLMRYNLRDRTLHHYFSGQPDDQTGPARAVFSFYVDTDNIVWIGSSSGLIRFDYRRNTYQTYETMGSMALSPIYSIAADQRGRLWLGTQRDGVLYFNKRLQTFGQVNTFTNDFRRLNDFEVSKVYVDNLGVIWANADPDGLARIVPDAFVFGGFSKRQTTAELPDDQRLSHYSIRGFLEERPGRLWVATEDGINVLDLATNRVVRRYLINGIQEIERRSKLPMHNLVKCLYRDSQQRIWVGSLGGVLLFRPETETFEPVLFSSSSSLVTSNYVRNLVNVNDSTLVAATEDGLYALNTRQRTWSVLPVLPGVNIFSLWFDTRTQRLWVGTYLKGFVCYQLPSADRPSAWRRVYAGLNGCTVLHIRQDAHQPKLWLATDRGVATFDTVTARTALYTVQQGLANAFVYGTLSDSGRNVWMSTNRGISRFDPSTRTFKNFTLSDGLQGYEFNGNAFCRTVNGEFFFGGVNGFNRFHPDQYRASSFNPRVHIYNLRINEEPFETEHYVDETSEIDLSYDQNTVSLEFAALDYFSNGYNTYQYQLTGYDAQWVSAGERNYVRYANLPPDRYVFQVKAAGRDGHWGSQVRQLIIHIRPPFWQTLSFMLLVVLTIGLLVFAWIRRRENAIRHQQADRLRLAYDIQEQVKKDIARDLHDEIGTRLATLKLYTTRLAQFVDETAEVRSLKENIFGLIGDTISDVRNLLRKLNPQTLEQYGYVAAVEELFNRINATSTGTLNAYLELTNAPGADTPEADGQADSLLGNRLPAGMEVMLYRITQELVNNSLKHANASRIDLSIQGFPDRLVLIYSDNGQGFDYTKSRQAGSGLGIGNIESRVAILNGRADWQTQPGRGIRITIEIPINRAYRRPPNRSEPLSQPQ